MPKNINLFKTLLTIVCFFSVCGCKPFQAESSKLKVTEGQQINSSFFPASVRLPDSGCSATFVSETTLITARHCVVSINQDFRTLPVTYAGVTGFVIGAGNYYPLDLSVVVFPKRVAPSFIPVATKSPFIGQDVTIVGFGSDESFRNHGIGTKRLGQNNIDRIQANIFSFKMDDGASHIGSGDSGGTAMNENHELIGVMISTTIEGDSWSNLTNLLAGEAQGFLREAVSRGAIINGLSASSGSGSTVTTETPTLSTSSSTTPSKLRYFFGANMRPAQVTIWSGQVFDGMKIEDIQTDSPADRAGFIAGDVVTLIDRQWVKNDTTWDQIVNNLGSAKVLIHYVRDDVVKEVWVTLNPNG